MYTKETVDYVSTNTHIYWALNLQATKSKLNEVK